MHQEHLMLILHRSNNTDVKEKEQTIPVLPDSLSRWLTSTLWIRVPPIFTAHLTKSKCFLSLPAILIYVNQLSQAFFIELVGTNGQ